MRSAFLSAQLFANIIQCVANVDCFTPSRSGRKVEYRFYKQLEQILGQEAVSIDEYDEKDEQVDQDSGTDVFTRSAVLRGNYLLEKYSFDFSNTFICLK